MVISRAAVSELLKGERRDSLTLKHASPEKIDRLLAKLDPAPHFHTKPLLHQKVCFLLGARHGSFFFIPDMGLGKTWIGLNLVKYFGGKAIALVPGQSNIASWVHEAKKHAPSLHVVGFDEGGSKDWAEILDSGEFDLIVCTYVGWLRLVCSLGPKRKGKRKMKIDKKLARKREALFSTVILDESSNIKNHLSLFYKAASRLSNAADRTYCLTGTPIDKNPTDFWTQFKVVDGGASLGRTLGLFREAFFTAKPRFWGMGFEYEFDERKKPILKRFVRHSSVRYRSRDCLDLPPIVGGISGGDLIIRPVTLPEETWHYYDRLATQAMEANPEDLQLKNAYLRLRQITSGFLPTTDEHGEKTTITFAENPKLEATIQLLREIPEGDKVIVFNKYKPSGEMICERLKKEGIKHVRIFSGTKSKREALERFDRDPKMRVLVGSPAINYGLNLQVANYLIVFETPDSLIERQQLEGRLPRPGQTKKMFIYDVAMKGTVDMKILRYLIKGKSLVDEIVDNRKLLART